MEFRGYDQWKTRSDFDEDPPRGGGVAYRCLDCGWTGREAFAHHVTEGTHHRVVLRDAPGWVAAFSCCPEQEAAPPEPETDDDDGPRWCPGCGAHAGAAGCKCDDGRD